MQLEFVARDLRRIDELSAELVACCVWQDERPFRGLAGLLDWRLGGKLSILARSGFISGRADEVLLVPGRPRVRFEKVLIMGLGARAEFGEDGFASAVGRLLRALAGLNVRRAVVELPGRGDDAIDPARATELLFEQAKPEEHFDAWWLVESPEAEKVMRARSRDELQRARRAAMQREETGL
jgi:hypothetical protein